MSVAATNPAEPEDGESAEVAGAPLQDWALLLGSAAGSFFLYWLISAGLLAIMRRFVADREKSAIYRFTQAALPPLSLFLAVVTFHLWTGSIEASIVARQTLLRYIGIVGWVALAWFALRLVDAIARVASARMERRQRRQAVSVVVLLRRTAKIVLFLLATVAVLDTLGVDVTTGIAALGRHLIQTHPRLHEKMPMLCISGMNHSDIGRSKGIGQDAHIDPVACHLRKGPGT